VIFDLISRSNFRSLALLQGSQEVAVAPLCLLSSSLVTNMSVPRTVYRQLLRVLRTAQVEGIPVTGCVSLPGLTHILCPQQQVKGSFEQGHELDGGLLSQKQPCPVQQYSPQPDMGYPQRVLSHVMVQMLSLPFGRSQSSCQCSQRAKRRPGR
jgi:hypothetical protein